MKKITLLIALLTVLTTYAQLGDNIVALKDVRGAVSDMQKEDNAEGSCITGDNVDISYPNGWYNPESETNPDWAGESDTADWKWNATVTDLGNIYFNGLAKNAAKYVEGVDTDINTAISINNTTDFELSAKSSFAANNSFDCDYKIRTADVIFSLKLLTPFVNQGDVRTVTITITDANGVSENIILTATYSTTASIEEFDSYDFKYAPNPIKDVLKVSAKTNIQKVEIYNILGQKSKSYTVNSLHKDIDVSSLSSGMYQMKVFIDNKVENYKIMKQ